MSVHINFGHSKRESDPDENCMYCDRHYDEMAYCYFGAPVCGTCWDKIWRKTEDGECDPPFAEIKHRSQGMWLP